MEDTRRVSQLCLIRIDRNRYSVPAKWANTVVSVRLTADRVRMVSEGQIIAERLTEAAKPITSRLCENTCTIASRDY